MSHIDHHTFQRLTHLGDIPIEQFLTEYWQKKPLLIRQAFPSFTSPITPDEIAGLSLDGDVTSRLVIEDPKTKNWTVEHGPLPEERFGNLPDSHWTLLIQHADTLDPDVNAILHAFRFIPNWRLDDIMISYAPDKGGVGPHFDYYDVFLLQAGGKRNWKLGQPCHSHSELLPNQPMKVLTEFNTTEEYVVEPGDLLYIPAGMAHWGEAIDESITYSIGFRAPSQSEVLLDLSQELASMTSEDDRYSDPDLQPQANSGEISQDAIEKFQAAIRKQIDNPTNIAKWFGQYSTELKQYIDFDLLNAVSAQELKSNIAVRLSPYARSAYFTKPLTCLLFINGETWNCSLALAQTLCEYSSFTWSDFTSEEDRLVLTQLAEHYLLEK